MHALLSIILALSFSLPASTRPDEFDYPYIKGAVYEVNAGSGLKLREKPSLQAKTLAVLPQGTWVMMSQPEGKTFGSLKVEGTEGEWVQARAFGQEGYLYSGFLDRIQHPDGDGAWKHQHPDDDPNFRLMWPGVDEFQEEWYDARFHWYSLSPTESGFALKKANMEHREKGYPTDAYPDYPSGTFLVGSRHALSPQTMEWDPDAYGKSALTAPILPGTRTILQASYGEASTFCYLVAEGKAGSNDYTGYDELGGDPYVGVTFTDYRIRLGIFNMGEEKPIPPQTVYAMDTLYWTPVLNMVGDVNGDEVADIVVEVMVDDSNEREADSGFVLFLSHKEGERTSFFRAASFHYWGGC